MGIYYFHIRDDFGVMEDTDGIELADMAAVLREVVRSACELSREGAVYRGMRFEIADAVGRTVLIAPVQEGPASWELMEQSSDARLPVHRNWGLRCCRHTRLVQNTQP